MHNMCLHIYYCKYCIIFTKIINNNTIWSSTIIAKCMCQVTTTFDLTKLKQRVLAPLLWPFDTALQRTSPFPYSSSIKLTKINISINSELLLSETRKKKCHCLYQGWLPFHRYQDPHVQIRHLLHLIQLRNVIHHF